MAGKFEPKTPVQLDPPKSDPIAKEELVKSNGKSRLSDARDMLEIKNVYM